MKAPIEFLENLKECDLEQNGANQQLSFLFSIRFETFKL